MHSYGGLPIQGWWLTWPLVSSGEIFWRESRELIMIIYPDNKDLDHSYLFSHKLISWDQFQISQTGLYDDYEETREMREPVAQEEPLLLECGENHLRGDTSRKSFLPNAERWPGMLRPSPSSNWISVQDSNIHHREHSNKLFLSKYGYNMRNIVNLLYVHHNSVTCNPRNGHCIPIRLSWCLWPQLRAELRITTKQKRFLSS